VRTLRRAVSANLADTPTPLVNIDRSLQKEINPRLAVMAEAGFAEVKLTDPL
jgi:hypothetical protein